MIDITLEKLLTTGSCVSFADRGFLPQSPGLYFVVCRDNLPRFAYIGKTQNLQVRWQNHH
ncbi:MAG: GIY-YIG nuclease family protein [Cyanobacteria bacterium SBLK]|nr:GIY-YIG nuclease family protein [Cyanobacteria bacterium SBLK]